MAPDIDLEAAVGILREAVPSLDVVYLFGSAARGDAHCGSDIDLALLAGETLEPLARFQLQERLAAQLHRDVDLLQLRCCSTVMRIQVIEHGRVLFERDPMHRQRFEMSALAAYARLNEERRGILEDVRKRGTVHG